MSTPGKIFGKEYNALLLDYEARYNEKPIHFSLPHVYDATALLFFAIESVAIKEKDGTLHIGREALRKALYKTNHYKGITGSLTCDSFGDFFAGPYSIIRLDDLSGGMEGFQANVVYQTQ
jgi:branched-chain amino acid transport system substrate-binding protein